MNILIPTADFPPIEGGISTLTRELARELHELGHDVTVLAPYFPNMDDFDQSETVTVVRYRGYRLGWLRLIPIFFAVRERGHWAEIILAINPAYGGLAARLCGKPYVAFAYAYEFLRFQNVPILASLLRWIYTQALCVVAISTFTRRALEDFGVSAKQIVTIHPGACEPVYIAEELLEKIRRDYVLEDHVVILAVGRLIPRKGHAILVQALPALLRRHPKAVLVIVGRGPEEVAIAREAHRLGVRQHIRFTGRISDRRVAALYQLCDLFALPTREDAHGHVEGFGLVFSEAHACGKPVVAGKSGGVEDAVLHGETGFVVDPTPEAVAEAILKLLDDPALAQRLGTAGRERVERELNWRAFAQRLLRDCEARL